jgi:ABC-type branched-subunit amino acid transport system substrate-binding protein
VERNGIPVVGPQTGGSFVNQPPKREIFTLRASYQKEAEAAIRLEHSIGVRSFGLVLADDAFGRDTLVNIERVFKELQLTPVASAKVDNRKPDVTEAVRTVLAARPQVVLLIVSSKAGSDFVKTYVKQGGHATFIALSNCSNNDFVQGLGDAARGVIVMQTMPSPFSATTALAREYGAAAARRKAPLSYAGEYGFAAAKLLALGLARAGHEPTPASLVAALESLGEVDLGGYRLHYGPGERSGSNYVDATIISASGRFVR